MSADSTPGKPGLGAEVMPGGDCGGVLTTMPPGGTGVLSCAGATAAVASNDRPSARLAKHFFMAAPIQRASVGLVVLVLGLRAVAQLGFPSGLVARGPVLCNKL